MNDTQIHTVIARTVTQRFMVEHRPTTGDELRALARTHGWTDSQLTGAVMWLEDEGYLVTNPVHDIIGVPSRAFERKDGVAVTTYPMPSGPELTLIVDDPEPAVAVQTLDRSIEGIQDLIMAELLRSRTLAVKRLQDEYGYVAGRDAVRRAINGIIRDQPFTHHVRRSPDGKFISLGSRKLSAPRWTA